MTSGNKFILKQVLVSLIPVAVLSIIFFSIEVAFATPEEPARYFDLPWLMTFLILAELVSFFYNLRTLKKMDIDFNLPENQNGNLNKIFEVDMSKEIVLKTYKQNVWKFKTKQIIEKEEGTILVMKYHRLFWNEKIEILISSIGEHATKVKIMAGYKDNPWKLIPVHTFWTRSIRHIKYFQGVLEKCEALHGELAQSI